MTLKVNMRVEKIELTVSVECHRCKRYKPLEAVGINPRTRKPYAYCNFCRARQRSRAYIGQEIIDADGQRWLVKGYLDSIDHREEYPYTCHSIGGDTLTVLYTDEAFVRAGVQRAKDMKG